MIEQSSLVALARDLEEHGLAAGDLGAVVYQYAGGEAFEVEFVSGEGKTLAVLTLAAADIRLMEGREILHARPL